MLTPTSRGQRGGSATRGGGRATPFQPIRGRGSSRGVGATPPTPRGRGRGRGAPANTSPSVGGDGLLQKLRAGTVKRGGEDATITPGGGTTIPRRSATHNHKRQAHFTKHLNRTRRIHQQSRNLHSEQYPSARTWTRPRICVAELQRSQSSDLFGDTFTHFLTCAKQPTRFHERCD